MSYPKILCSVELFSMSPHGFSPHRAGNYGIHTGEAWLLWVAM